MAGDSHFSTMQVMANITPKINVNTRDISAAGHAIQTGNQMQKMPKVDSKRAKTHLRGRDAGRSQW
jgi:hypothetical protein